MATRKEIGEHLDLSVQNVGRLVSDGVLYAERGVGGDLDECRIAYIRHLRKRATGQKRTSESLDEARTRKTSADASISEAKEELLRGSLVPVDDVKSLWESIITTANKRLSMLPDSLAGQIEAAQDIHHIKSILQNGINESLESLRDHPVPDADTSSIESVVSTT